MADDAHTEARRRIAEAIGQHRRAGAYCSCGWKIDHGFHSDHQADAVLNLFEEAAWSCLLGDYRGPLPAPPEATIGRRLVLRGPVEPVTEEPADADI